MICELNLPPPSKLLTNLVLAEFQKQKNNPIFEKTRQEREEFQNKNVTNLVHQVFNDYIKTLGLQEYQKYFTHPINLALVAFVNTKKITACFPPHTDNYRGLAVNYYLKVGGDNVVTTYYKEKEESSYNGTHKKYEDVTIDRQFYERDYNKWLAFDTRIFHSIENIETERITLSINFGLKDKESVFTYNDFVLSYPNLISKYL